MDAALAVLDAVGMDGLSMRRVAQELGTGAASLYWHVRNKDELFQLVFDRVTREIVLPEPDAGPLAGPAEASWLRDAQGAQQAP